MAIELSDITFTDQDDIVPLSGVDQIFNRYRRFANTLLGNDTITGIGSLNYNDPTSNYGIFNSGTLDMAEGNDVITGTTYGTGIYNSGTLNLAEGNDVISGTATNSGIINFGILDTAEGDDIITTDGQRAAGFNNGGRLDTGEGDDIIIGEGYYWGITNGGNFDTGDGNDRIRGIGDSEYWGGYGILNSSLTFNTGDGNDTIDGTGSYGIYNSGFINTGNGEDIIIIKGKDEVGSALFNSSTSTIDTGGNDDIIIGSGGIDNYGNIDTGDGDDSLTASILAEISYSNRALENFNAIETGEGNDIITSTDIIYNQGVINTGNGNDSIIAKGGFESGSNSTGGVFLGNGEDYIKGFGSGNFYGESGNDILELTPGTYTVGISGTMVNFTKYSAMMITSEFEQLKAGSTTYDFTSLTAGQIIVVA